MMFYLTFCNLFWQNNPESLELLKALRRDSPQPDEDRIIAYLEADLAIFGIGFIDRDRFTGADLRGAATLTDGTWIWPNCLAHYVRHYHFRIPA
jgi:hypothetical protein